MKYTIAALFNTSEQADRALRELTAAGVPQIDVSVVARNRSDADDADGATTGLAVGATAGFLAGIPLLAVPGLGPVAAAGWLLTALTGAAAGGLIGALVDAGISEEEAQVYAEGVRRGSIVMVVRADDADVERVRNVLKQAGAVEITERARAYPEAAEV